MVGGVLDPVGVRGAAERDGVVAGDGEHGAEEEAAVEGAGWEQACETFWPGAAEEAHEDGFELVVGVVGGGDEGAGVVFGDGFEGGVAEGARAGLVVMAFGFGGDLLLEEWEVEACGEVLGGVARGEGFAAGAHVVDDVGDGEVGGGAGEGEGEGHGIDAAGAGDEGHSPGVTDFGPAGQASPIADDETNHPRGGGGGTDQGSNRPIAAHGPMIE